MHKYKGCFKFHSSEKYVFNQLMQDHLLYKLLFIYRQFQAEKRTKGLMCTQNREKTINQSEDLPWVWGAFAGLGENVTG